MKCIMMLHLIRSILFYLAKSILYNIFVKSKTFDPSIFNIGQSEFIFMESSIYPKRVYALAVCRAHWGLPVGFLLLWYSVLSTV